MLTLSLSCIHRQQIFDLRRLVTISIVIIQELAWRVIINMLHQIVSCNSRKVEPKPKCQYDDTYNEEKHLKTASEIDKR